jgi:glycyl-tRNA synthetase
VTVRDRDSMEQVRVPVERLPEVLSALISGAAAFRELRV